MKKNLLRKPERTDPPYYWGRGWGIYEELKLPGSAEKIPSVMLQEIDPSIITLRNFLWEGENSMTGTDRLQRIAALKGEFALDPMFAIALKKNASKYPQEWKDTNTFGITPTVFFDGFTLSGPDGNRYSLHTQWSEAHGIVLGRMRVDWERGAPYLSAIVKASSLPLPPPAAAAPVAA